jgi:hypothetical protein
MTKCWTQQPAIADGGKAGNIRRHPGQSIRAMTNRSVALDTDGGKKRKKLRGIETKKHEATFIGISSLRTTDRGRAMSKKKRMRARTASVREEYRKQR